MKLEEINGVTLSVKKVKEDYLVVANKANRLFYSRHSNLKTALEDIEHRVELAEKINQKINKIKLLDMEDRKVIFKYCNFTCNIIIIDTYYLGTVLLKNKYPFAVTKSKSRSEVFNSLLSTIKQIINSEAL